MENICQEQMFEKDRPQRSHLARPAKTKRKDQVLAIIEDPAEPMRFVEEMVDVLLYGV